uniref:CSON012789 protein n=1 Tax=Culicoides sonorensis TaxID=179676 RepID=A0A336K4P1_CULSO
MEKNVMFHVLTVIKMFNSPVLGIDFGASKIVVACCDVNKNDKCEVILDQEEARSTSCCLSFTQNERLFSKAAEYQANTNPENTIFGRDIKRIMGCNYEAIMKNIDSLSSFINLKKSGDDEEFRVDIRNDKQKLSRLRNACEKVKIILSSSRTASELIPTFHNEQSYELKINRDSFERLCDSIFLKITSLVTQTIKGSELNQNDISEFIMIGGGGRIPKIESALKELFNGRQISKTLNQDESTAVGAAYFGAKINEKISVKSTLTSHLTIELPIGKLVTVQKGTQLPTYNKSTFLREIIWSSYFNLYQGHQLLTFIKDNSPVLRDTSLIHFITDVDQNGLISLSAVEEDGKKHILVDHRKINYDMISKINALNENFAAIERERQMLLKLSNDLENCLYSYKRKIISKEIIDILTDEEKTIIRQICDEMLNWLESTKTFDKEVLIEKREFLEDTCNTIIKNGKRKCEIKRYEDTANEYYNRKNFSKAIEIYSKLINESRDDPSMSHGLYLFKRALSYIHLQEFDNAIIDFRNVLESKDFDYTIILKSHFLQAKCYFEIGNYLMCLKGLDTLLEYEPTQLKTISVNLRYDIIKLKFKATLEMAESFITQKNTPEAEKLFDKLIEQVIKGKLTEVDNNLAGEIYLKRALFKHHLNKNEEALKDLEQAKKLMENQMEVLKLRAKCYYVLERFDEANFDIDFVLNQECDREMKLLKEEIEMFKLRVDLKQYNQAWKLKDNQNVIKFSNKMKNEYTTLDFYLWDTVMKRGIEVYYEMENFRAAIQDCDILLQENKNDLWALNWKKNQLRIEENMETVKNAPVLGIDFGASKIVLAYCDVNKNNKCEVILDQEEARSTSCCLAFTQNERLFSKAAEYQANTNPENTIFGRDIKQIIGGKFEDTTKTLKTFLNLKQSSENDDVIISVKYKNESLEVLPEHVIAMLISKLKENAENRTGKTFSHVVVSVPSVFNTFQRYALRNAISAAGFKEISLINNTTAAAVRYATERDIEDSKNILIFDMGATSLEVGIFNVSKNNIKTLANNGTLQIGGESFVNELINYFINDFELKFNDDIRSDKQKLSRLRNACEKVKTILSASSNATELIPTFHNNDPYELQINREYFDHYCDPLFNKIRDIVNQTIQEYKLNLDDISEFVIIGGGGRIPRIEYVLKEIFNGRHISKTMNQDESIAIGAAYYGARYNYDLNVTEISSNHLRIKPLGGDTILALKKGIKLPATNETSLIKEKYSFWYFPYTIFQGSHAFASLDNSDELDDSTLIDFNTKIDKNGLIYLNIKSDYDTSINFTLLDHRHVSNQIIKKINELISKFENVEKERKKLLKLSNELEGYAYSYKRKACSKDLNEILTPDQKNVINKICDEVLYWLDKNKISDKEQLLQQRERLDDVCNTIIENAKRKFQRFRDSKGALEHFDRQEYSKAVKMLNNLISEFDPRDDLKDDFIDHHYKRGISFYNLKEYDEALTDFEFILNENICDFAFLLKCKYMCLECLFHIGKFGNCLEEANSMLNTGNLPEKMSTKIFTMKIKCTFSLLDRNQSLDKKEVINHLIELVKAVYANLYGEIDKNIAGEIFYRLAFCKYSLKDFEGAIFELDKAVTLVDNFYEVYKLRAQCHFEVENFDAAESDIEVALNYDKNDVDMRKLQQAIQKIRKEQRLQNDLFIFEQNCKAKNHEKLLDQINDIRKIYAPMSEQLTIKLIKAGIEASFNLQRYNECLDNINVLLQKSDKDMFALRWRVRVNSAKNQIYNHQRVLEDCKKIHEEYPDDEEMNNFCKASLKIIEENGKRGLTGKIKSVFNLWSEKQPIPSKPLNNVMDVSDGEDPAECIKKQKEKYSASPSHTIEMEFDALNSRMYNAVDYTSNPTEENISGSSYEGNAKQTSEANYTKPTKASTAKEKKHEGHDKNRPPYRTRSFTNQQYKNSNYQNQ